jgi:hypothetical protein
MVPPQYSPEHGFSCILRALIFSLQRHSVMAFTFAIPDGFYLIGI